MRDAARLGMTLGGLLSIGLGAGHSAAEPPSADPSLLGRNVRVEIGSDTGNMRLRGRVLELTGNSLLVRREGTRSEDVSIRLDQVTRLEVRSGSHHAPGTGAAFGALLGAGGGFLAMRSLEYRGDDADLWRNVYSTGGALAGGAVGALVGLVIGALVHVDTWAPAPVPKARPVVANVPQSHGVRMEVAFRF